MTERRPTERQRAVRLQVTANLLERESAAKIPEGAAYVFSSGGRLLAHGPLDEQGRATLNLTTGREPRALRVMIGPRLEESAARISELQRRGAVESHLRLDPGNLNPSVDIAILPNVWGCWLLGLCFVSGTLLKQVVSGGVTLDLPVCNATVEVYEVDPLEIIIPRLPDLIIEKIRQVIINPPPPPPPPDGPFGLFRAPRPGPDPAPEVMRMGMAHAPSSASLLSVGEAAPRAVSALGDLQFLARATDTFQFRQALVDYSALIHPILCWFFPPFLTTTLVATAITDDCGHFQTVFWRGCINPDTPDLYFKATQNLFGFFPVTIYAPTPIACYTYWNYACGTEVTLYTTNPLAVTCKPCPPVDAPNNWVLVMAVGNHPLSLIRGTAASLQATTTAANLGLTDGDAPWGGLLGLRIEFDNSLRDDLGVQYYQVSYRRGTSGCFTPLFGEVHRHYAHVVGTDLVLEVYPLGPKVINGVANLFEIPPALPPLGQWSFPDLREDLTSAKFPTVALAPAALDGKYQIKVDLYDSAGALVDVAATGINYRVPTSTDLSGTIHTDDAGVLGLVPTATDLGIVSCPGVGVPHQSFQSFVMTLHIDNNSCSASLAAPVLDGNAADDCGVLEYDTAAPGMVTLAYTASHPHGFANYGFSLYRGVHLLTPPTVGSAPVGAGSFSATQTVNSLLAGCSIAGFSENLSVAAMATNGWERLSGYDDSKVGAFVLAPAETP